MKLTTRGRYAVTAMLDLVLYGQGRPVMLNEVAVRQEIPISYLGQLFSKLRKQGLVNSQRGPGGGYRLAKPPEGISIADVMLAVEENIDNTRCGGKVDCQNSQRCLAHGLWESLSRNIFDFLNDVSLAKAVAEHEVLEVAKRQALSSERSRGEVLQIRQEHFSGAQT